MPVNSGIVGRSSEMAQIEAEWRRATTGQFRCVVVLGEFGTGKTRLAAEVATAPGPGALRLTAQTDLLGRDTTFGLWAEALESHLRHLQPATVEGLCGGLVDDLAGILRSAAAVLGTVPERQPPRARLLESLAALIGNLARQAPLLLVFDDAHQADDATWSALRYLARSLPDAPVLVVVTARPAELVGQPMASHVLLDLEQEGIVRRIRLGPLPRDALHELAGSVTGGVPPQALVDWLSARSGGIPLFAVGLLQGLLDEGSDLAAPALGSVPPGISERVRSRVALLDLEDQTVLEVLAVLGRRTDLGDLAEVLGPIVERLDGVLERLVRSGLVVEEKRARRLTYEISHPLVAEAVYQALGGARRVTLHRTAGRALLAAGRLREAASHFTQSGDLGDDEAIGVIRSALRNAEEREAYREVLELFGALVELMPPGDDRWLAMADVLSPQGEWVLEHGTDLHAAYGVQALREIDSALDQAPDPARQARVKSRLASLSAWSTGALDEAERVCREAVALCEAAGERRDGLLASLELAYIRGMGGDLRTLESGARSVLEAATAAGDRSVMLYAFGVAGLGALCQGHFAQAAADLERSATMAGEDGNRHRLTWSLAALGWLYGLQGQVGPALQAIAEAKRKSPSWRESIAPEVEAQVHWLTGNFRASVDCMSAVLASSPGTPASRRGVAVVAAAMSAAELGHLGQARDLLDLAGSVSGDRNFFFSRPLRRHAEALLCGRDGRPEAALPLLVDATEELAELHALAFVPVPLLDLAELSARTGGQTDAAARAAERLMRLAAETDNHLLQAVAPLAAAWADKAAGRGPEAAAAAQDAIRLLAPLGYPVLHGRALDAFGLVVARTDRGLALTALSEAAAIFETIGATWRRDRTLKTLRELGGRGRRAASAVLGPASLTAREREVARLAAQLLTAKEIANLLFLSERTIEGHLANVYAKLGVHSKPDFARRATEFGLT
jgi:ATP/maltotriose-dependent transcriptional regulator MalT